MIRFAPAIGQLGATLESDDNVMPTPYIGFGSDELSDKPIVHAGDVFICQQCGQFHELMSSTDDKGDANEIILFYPCGGNYYLAAVKNRLVMDTSPTFYGYI